jgi:gas vesicle protein
MNMNNPIDAIFKGNKTKKRERRDRENRFLIGLVFSTGLLIGSLISAGVTLLLAPQSGKKTRRQIQRKSRDLREQTTEAIEEGVDQVRAKAHQVTAGIQEQTTALQQRGQNVVDKGKERWDAVVTAGKAAVNGS